MSLVTNDNEVEFKSDSNESKCASKSAKVNLICDDDSLRFVAQKIEESIHLLYHLSLFKDHKVYMEDAMLVYDKDWVDQTTDCLERTSILTCVEALTVIYNKHHEFESIKGELFGLIPLELKERLEKLYLN